MGVLFEKLKQWAGQETKIPEDQTLVKLKRVILVKVNGIEMILNELGPVKVLVERDSVLGAKVKIEARPGRIDVVSNKFLTCSVCGKKGKSLTVTNRGSVCGECFLKLRN